MFSKLVDYGKKMLSTSNEVSSKRIISVYGCILYAIYIFSSVPKDENVVWSLLILILGTQILTVLSKLSEVLDKVKDIKNSTPNE